MKPDALADLIVGLVKNALSPVLERVAAVETRILTLGDVRDRVVGLEAKSSVVVALPTLPDPIDLTPLLERLAAVESWLGPVDQLRDRMAAVETKTALDLSDRVAAIDSRLAVISAALADPDPTVAALTKAEASIAELTKDLTAVRERVAVVETKASVPGPAGPAGRDGANGVNGADGHDGHDGVTLDDLSLHQQDERTLVMRATVGAKVKDLGSVTFPVDIWRGVWLEGKVYERGDGVTWDGAVWHANQTTTTKPGDGSKAWTLKVKRGRDGKDGKDAPGALPVVRTQ